MALNPNQGHFSEQGFLRDSLKRTDDDLLKAKIQNMQGARFGGGDVLSQALANKLQGAYQGQMTDIQKRFGRENPVQAARLDQVSNNVIGNNYANVLDKEAKEHAADEMKKAKKKARTKAAVSLAAAIAGTVLTGGTAAGAMLGGGAGGLLAGGD